MMSIRCKYSIIHGMEIQNLIMEGIIIGIMVLFHTGIRIFQSNIQQVVIIFSNAKFPIPSDNFL